MEKTRLGKRFFESTRGRIVRLLRGTTCTVNELVEELGLTDNAVRAHLLTLERDGLVKQAGMQRGHRKPHFAYELTAEAESLFPKAYDSLLNQLITVLQERLTARSLREVLRQVGRSFAAANALGKRGSLNNRAENALKVLADLGGVARIEKANGKLSIVSGSCPLAAAVAEHPEVCQLTEALVSEIVGTSVQERCDRSGPPRCRFEIEKD
jgi:predicted ArsR family transcriptional regulator